MTDCPAERVLRWENGEMPGPWYVTIYPTNRCNLQCAMCWQRRFDTLDFSDEVPDERLLELVDECAELGVKEWTVVGGGEPMIRAELVIRLCERICARGMNGCLQTNGLVFTSEHFERLMNAGWAEVAFSLDGATREINDDIRSKGSFDRATSTIRRLSALKREHRSSTPFLYLATVLTSTNYTTLDAIVELAHDLGCNGLRGAPLIPDGESCLRFQLSEQQRSELRDSIGRAVHRAGELGLTENYSWLLEAGCPRKNEDVRDNRRACVLGIMKSPCFEPWMSIIVLPDGKVGPCCAFWDEHAISIKDNSLKAIWMGYLQQLRLHMQEGRMPAYCARCQPWLRTRTDMLRREAEGRLTGQDLARTGVSQRVRFLTAKSVASIRRYGFRQAVHRGFEWLRIRASTKRRRG